MRIRAIVSHVAVPVAAVLSVLVVAGCTPGGAGGTASATTVNSEPGAASETAEPPAAMHKPTSASALQPPVARQEAFVIKSPFGDRTDEYYWLRNDNSEKKPDDIMAYLNGTTIDFKDEIMGRGFVFTNPNASTTCGCGSSFSA